MTTHSTDTLSKVLGSSLNLKATQSKQFTRALQAYVDARVQQALKALAPSQGAAPQQSLAEQQAALRAVRKASKAFTNHTPLDAPAILEILATDTLSADEMAKSLKMSRQQVDLRRKQHELLALQGSKRGYRYPKWQNEPALWRSLPPVLKLLKDEQPWDVYSFLQGEFPALQRRSPLTLLRQGETDRVLRFVREAFAMPGASKASTATKARRTRHALEA